MSGRFIINVCTAIEVGCMMALAGIALKRNDDCYKAEIELAKTRFENSLKDIEIACLKDELRRMKSKQEEES